MLLKIAEIGPNEIKLLGPIVEEFKKIGWVVESVPSSSHDKVMSCGAYLIIHPSSKKCYIGSHKNLYSRQYQHHYLLNHKKHWLNEFQAEYNKDPKIIPLFIITNDREEAYDLEQLILDKFYGTDLLFNKAKDARLALKGIEVSVITRNKLSIAGSNRILSPEHRTRIGAATTKRYKLLSKEDRDKINEKISNSHLGKIQSPERRALSKIAAMKNAKKILVDGINYESIAAVERTFNICASSVIKRIKSSNFPSWHYESDINHRPVSIKGIIYDSINAYSIEHNLNIDIVKIRIDSTNEIYGDWIYLDQLSSSVN